MADRVHFATNNDTPSGFNGFSILINDNGEVWNQEYEDIGGQPATESGDYSPNYQMVHETPNSILVGNGTDMVGPFTFREAITIFWRVKSWRVTSFSASSSCSMTQAWYTGSPGLVEKTISSSTGGAATHSPHVSSIYYQPSLPTSEREIILNRIVLGDYSHNTSTGVGFAEWIYDRGDPGYEPYSVGNMSCGSGASATFGFGTSPIVAVKKDKIRIEDFDYYFKFEVGVFGGSSTWFGNYDGGRGDGYGQTASSSLGLVKPAGRSYLWYPYMNGGSGNPDYGKWLDYSNSISDSPTYYYEYGDSGTLSISPISGTMTMTVPESKRILTVPLYGFTTLEDIAKSHSLGAVSNATTSASSLSVAPFEYWPYANSENKPVWDKDTGLRTANPND